MIPPFEFWSASTADIQLRIGISSCLLGEPVRYDGGHKRQWQFREMEAQCRFVAFCPELAAGMGTPRAPIQLRAEGDRIRARTVAAPHRDVTTAIYASSTRHCRLLQQQGIQGYILKARSPSCGLNDAPLLRQAAAARDEVSSGIFATQLQRSLPQAPVLNEEQLSTAQRCRHFMRLCRLGAEFQRINQPGSGVELAAWHRHYLQQLPLPDSSQKQLEALLDNQDGGRAYWQGLKACLLQPFQSTPVGG